MTDSKSPPQPAVSVEQQARELLSDEARKAGWMTWADAIIDPTDHIADDDHIALSAIKRALSSAAPPADGVLRALQGQEDAEDARNTCSECDGEGQWEHCPVCALNFGRAIDLRRAALAGTSMAAFGASEAACYHYPGAHQQAERAAFCHGSEYASAAPKAPTAPIGEAGEAYQGFQAAVSAIRSWAAGFSDEMTQRRLRAVAKDLEDNRAEILGAALSPSAGAERPRASQFIGWIADRFAEKHIPALNRDKALAMAWATLDCAESDGCVFGHPDFDWMQDGANALADEEIELWEPAP